MIQVDVYRGSGDIPAGIEVSGHAGYDEPGRDIICAAVSALTLNMANSVEQFTEDAFEGESEEETGRFSFRFTGTVSREGALLFESLVLGLTAIEESYGEEYISIRFKEV